MRDLNNKCYKFMQRMQSCLKIDRLQTNDSLELQLLAICLSTFNHFPGYHFIS